MLSGPGNPERVNPAARPRQPRQAPPYYGTHVGGRRTRTGERWHIRSRMFPKRTVCGLPAGGEGWYGDFSAPPQGGRVCGNCARMAEAETA